MMFLVGLIIFVSPTAKSNPVGVPNLVSHHQADDSQQYFSSEDSSIGYFLPVSHSVSFAQAGLSREWSTQFQIRIFGVAASEPIRLITDIQKKYCDLRNVMVLHFSTFDIVYPFHSFW